MRKHHWKGYLSTVMEGMEYHTRDILEALRKTLYLSPISHPETGACQAPSESEHPRGRGKGFDQGNRGGDEGGNCSWIAEEDVLSWATCSGYFFACPATACPSRKIICGSLWTIEGNPNSWPSFKVSPEFSRPCSPGLTTPLNPALFASTVFHADFLTSCSWDCGVQLPTATG